MTRTEFVSIVHKILREVEDYRHSYHSVHVVGFSMKPGFVSGRVNCIFNERVLCLDIKLKTGLEKIFKSVELFLEDIDDEIILHNREFNFKFQFNCEMECVKRACNKMRFISR